MEMSGLDEVEEKKKWVGYKDSRDRFFLLRIILKKVKEVKFFIYFIIILVYSLSYFVLYVVWVR